METVIRAVAIYFVVLLIIRLSGRRTLAQMTPFDLVLVLIVAETTQQALLGEDFSITNAALLIITLFGLDIGLSYVKQYWPWLAHSMDGKPTLLIADGEPDERALRRTRVSIEDIMSAAREAHGLERSDQVKHAVLETNGQISVVPKSSG